MQTGKGYIESIFLFVKVMDLERVINLMGLSLLGCHYLNHLILLKTVKTITNENVGKGPERMKCKYCDRGMMYITGDSSTDVYQCVDCGAIAIKDTEVNKNEYRWWTIEPTDPTGEK